MAKAKKTAKGKVAKKKTVKGKSAKKAKPKKAVKKVAKKVSRKAKKAAKKIKKVAKRKVIKKVKKATKSAVRSAKKKTKPATKKVKKAVKKARKVAKKAVKKTGKAAKKVVEKVKKVSAPKPVKERKSESKVTKPEKPAPRPVPELHNFPVINQRPIAHTPPKTVVKDERTRYSDEELKEFEELINRKLATAREEFRILKDTLNRANDEGTDSTSGGNTKVLEDGAETAEKENLSQLAARQLKYITNLENALIRIKNGTYGICSVTGKLISKERLIAVPHTTQSIEAKMMKRD